ncbi:MAG: hypothetical protein HKP32_06165 [Woeseia sp.]|nr:hypothetical protein [Woeseia sp.]NNL54717.1 hypothetical protein [Woeseia sp.]
MSRRSVSGSDRARQVLAQEAARIICEQGIEDYRLAKIKAAERLGMSEHGALPGNPEIEQAISEHLALFGRESHSSLLQILRQSAISAMHLLTDYTPRLVGPVLNGTAGETSAVNLHVFADSPEQVAWTLDESRVLYRPFERRYKSRRNQTSRFAAFRFNHDDASIEATVFPFDGIRQAPISPIDGKPMQRADLRAVRALVDC